MKKLIYIDNDIEKVAHEDVDYAKDNIERYFNLPTDFIDSMEIHANFSQLSKDEMYALLFSDKNIICTWSMYTTTHYNSLGQLINLLSGAGRNGIKNITYIDGSGQLLRVIDDIIKNNKHTYHILQAIETNNIISYDSISGKGGRVRIDLKGNNETCYKIEPIDLFELFLKEDSKEKGDFIFSHDLSDVKKGDIIYTRTGVRHEITEIKTDSGYETFYSDGASICSNYPIGHNMRSKKPYIAKPVK